MDVKIEESWKTILADEFQKDYFRTLTDFVRTEYQSTLVFPPESLIFNAFNKCPFTKLKVVILGQDPYHGAGQAHGLSFSVPDGERIPPSLRNIFKELADDMQKPIPQSGDLSAWAEQGVLLLNTTLTVREASAGSHQKRGWETFTDAVISQLSSQAEHICFILWGNFAINKQKLIDQSKHLVLTSVHPSPLSANRGFFGNHHFSKANQYLVANGKAEIVW
ncbi:MAG: uracil-DNA glycosylase [Mangrovibacterium sp.]